MLNTSPHMSPIRLMIVDDHDMLRQALAMALKNFDDMLLVGEVSSGAEAVELCGKVKPDVVLMDLVMDGIDGIAATRAIREIHTTTRVLIFSTFKDADRVEAALQAGADNYLFKNIGIEQLVGAIRTTYRRGQKPPNGLDWD